MKKAVVAILSVLALAAVPAFAEDSTTYYGDQIPPEVEAVYSRGLNWLARSLEKGDMDGGRGSYESGPGITGLALLAILAHGEDPNTGPYARAVRKALDSILAAQNQQTGYMGSSMYHHGFATLALAEAYGAVNDPRIGPALKRAVNLILVSQKNNPRGGWRYSPDADDADTTISGAQMVALMAARNAGIAVPDEAIKRALNYYKSCQDENGDIGYTDRGGGSGPRNAIATLVSALAGQKDSKLFRGAWGALLRGGGESGGGYLFYYLYYSAQAYFRADMKMWKAWNAQNLKNLQDSQGADGSWEGQNGAMFCTSTALLSLALNYRLLPIYER